MKKKNLKSLNLNKKSVSILTKLSGGKLLLGSDCEGTCSCECSNVITCGGEKSICLACQA